MEVLAKDQQTILDTVHERAPGALVPDIETIYLYPDYNDTKMGRRIQVDPADTRVLSLGLSGTVNPKVDGTWDGLFHIEVQDSDGKWHRRQCREFWIDGKSEYNISIDRPWRNLTDTNMRFRLYQPYAVLRADATQVLDAQVYDATRTLLMTLPEGWAHYFDRNDFQGRSKGRPEAMYRSKAFQLPAPNRAPTVALATGDPYPPWVGPEPTGVFAYCFTYVWGRRDTELVAPGGTLDPTFESSPSPESALATAPSDASRALDITLPEIDHQLNFNVTGAPSASHSGYRIRIYRRRVSVTGTTGKTRIEYPNVYQFLAEVDGATTTYRDNGSAIPDYFRRLPETHGYYLWRIIPFQNDEYQLDVRVRRKPERLLNDYDAPRVDPAANEMLVLGLMAKLYRKKGNFVEATNTQKRFEDALAEYQGRFASPAAIVPGIMRDTATRPGRDWGRRITLGPYKES